MLHEIVIQLASNVANELLQRSSSTLQDAHDTIESESTRELIKLANALNVELIPHQHESSDESSEFFSIVVQDAEQAKQLAAKIESCKGVNQVFVKPQGSPPG